MADIWQGIKNLGRVPSEHLDRLGEAYNDPPWSNTPEYHQWATKDFVEEKANQLADVPYVGDVAADVFKKVAPVGAFGASLLYDPAQAAFYKYPQDPGKYETNNKWDKVNAYFPDLQGTTASGILNAIDMENPLSAAYNRMIGAGQVGIESKINQQNQIQDLLKKGWGAIKNEFSGDVEASEMPINNITSSRILPEKKPFQYDYNTADAFTADEMATQPIDELTEDSSGIMEILKMAGRFINPFKKNMNPLGFLNSNLAKLNFRNSNLYRGATQGASGYTPTQLNQMNALGGYYSEPARNQRRTEKRIENMLARRAQGKSYSAKNLKTLSGGQYNFGGGQQGSHQTPTRSAPAGVTTSSGMHGGRHYNRGGLAGLWPR